MKITDERESREREREIGDLTGDDEVREGDREQDD